VPPERYIVPEVQVRASNFYPVNHIQGPPMVNSNTFASNVYNRPPYEGHQVVQTIVNDPRLQRSNMPVQQIITGSQIQGHIQGQIHPMSESLSYSSQFRPMVNPTGQQSGVYAQRQSYMPPGSNYRIYLASSSVMTSSFHPHQQAPLPTVGSNVIVTQSNYLPNYQFRQ
jgi:hypothetical protein